MLSIKASRLCELRSSFFVLASLMLGCAVLIASCQQGIVGQNEIAEPTDDIFATLWAPKDAAAIQACMSLDLNALASSLSSEYLEDPTYCEMDSDCYCLSGSGVPFVGCANAYHARISFAGCFACNECACIDNTCQLP